MQFAIQQLSTQVLTTHDREQARSETVDTISQRHATTLVFVLNRAKWFKKVCWNGRGDSDSAGDSARRQSVTGYHCDVQNVTLCNRSLKQTAISLSSCEADFHAASACAGELLGLAELFKKLHKDVSVRLEMDSDSARHTLQRRRPGGLKHIELRCLAIQTVSGWIANTVACEEAWASNSLMVRMVRTGMTEEW